MPTPQPDMTSVQYIPFTAWEQAVFVALFIIFCGGVFYSLRWVINSGGKFVASFQEYLRSRDEQNQRFLTMILEKQSAEEKMREEQFGNRNNALAEALDRNTQALMNLQQFVSVSLAEMRQNLSNQKTHPRSQKE